jgi:twinkle protein
MALMTEAEFKPLTKRRITLETVKKFGYQIGSHNGKPVQIAPYHNKDGELVAQKIRYPDKTFTVFGDMKDAVLFGQRLWNSGKRIVITEGEIDALSVSQVQGNKWPVVSLRTGAAGAVKDIKNNLEFLEGFEEVVLMFDMDEAGQTAARKCADLFTPGKARIAQLPAKDPNELLVAGKPDEITKAMWSAQTHRPDGIVSAQELKGKISRDDFIYGGLDYPFQGLNRLTHGLRTSEVVTVTAGTGIGKSAIVREITHHLLGTGATVGVLMLEESIKKTAVALAGLMVDKPLHLVAADITDEEFEDAMDRSLDRPLVLYDHFGSTEVENILSRVRYMAKGLDCKWIVLDHLSIVVSGLGDGDERRLIDNAMTAIRTLVQELDIGMIVVSHLKRPEGKGHENGAETSLAQLRGSAAIGQLSDIVIGIERNQQAEGRLADVSTMRVLKNRFSGKTGVAGWVIYNHDTGRLIELMDDPFADGEQYGFSDETGQTKTPEEEYF